MNVCTTETRKDEEAALEERISMEKGDYGIQIWQVLDEQNPNVTITGISDSSETRYCVIHQHKGYDKESEISCEKSKISGGTRKTYEETFNITGNIYYDAICRRFKLKLEEKEVMT